MQGNIVSAVFDNYSEAERAIADHRAVGVDNDAISVIGRHEGETTETSGSVRTARTKKY